MVTYLTGRERGKAASFCVASLRSTFALFDTEESSLGSPWQSVVMSVMNYTCVCMRCALA